MDARFRFPILSKLILLSGLSLITSSSCPESYMAYNPSNGKCYFSTYHWTWDTHKGCNEATCSSKWDPVSGAVVPKAYTGSLISIESQAEQNFINMVDLGFSQELFTGIDDHSVSNTPHTWIGLYYSKHTSSWQWSGKYSGENSSSVASTYRNWGKDTTFYTRKQPVRPYCVDFNCAFLAPANTHLLKGIVNPTPGWISGSCAAVRPCLCQLESLVTPDYRDALKEYLYSSPSNLAWGHFCRSSFDYPMLTYTSSLVSTVIWAMIFVIILPILSFFWTPGFIDGYRFSEVKQAQRPLPSNDSQDVVILQCPNAAGSGSTMVVCGPLSGSLVRFIVPLGVEAGDYFELEEWVDGTVTCSRIEQPQYPSPPTNLPLWLRLFYRFRLYYFLPCIPGGILKSRPTSDYLVTYFAFPFFGWPAVSDPGVARYLHKSMKNAVPEIIDKKISPSKVTVSTEAFEFIKGFGCLQVFMGHYQLWTKVDYGHDNGVLREADFGGGTAVFMFFLMSGMLLTIGYASRAEASLLWAWDFILMRFSRLAPSCWFALSLFIPFIFMQKQYGKNSVGDYYMTERNDNIKSMLGSMFFLNGWTDLYQGVGNNYNLVLWSTTAQLYCYLWFPLLVLPLHTVRNTARFIGEVLSFYSLYLFVSLLLFWWAPPYYTFGYAVKYQGQYNYPLLHFNVHNKVPLFLMGVVAGSQALTNMSVVKSELYTLRWSYVCNSLTVFMLSLFVLEAIVGYTIHGAGYTLRLNLELALPPVYMVWLYSFTQAPTCVAYRWCCWKPFLLMGKYSFCVYLLHFPIITYYTWARFGLEYWKTSSDATRLYAWEIIPCYAIVFMVAMFTHHFIEEPSRDFTYKALSRISSFLIYWIINPIWLSLTECWYMVN